MALTDRVVKNLKATGKPQKLVDGGGLYLRVTPNGTKTWWYRRQVDAKDRWKRLGRYPTVTLLDARRQASDAAGRGFLAHTVQRAWEEYLPHLRSRYDSHKEIERRLARDFVVPLEKRQLDRLTKADCADAVQAIVRRGAPVAAKRTLADLKHFLEWCTDRGWIQGNPAGGIRSRSLGEKESSRERALSLDELPQLLCWLLSPRFPDQVQTRVGLALILLTGQRPSEVLGLQEKEVRGTWWEIPGERTKNGKLQKVYLSPQARRLVQFAIRRWGNKPFRVDHRVLSKAVQRFMPKFQGQPFTPHDLRRTMSTRLADLGVAPHIVEKMLNHRMEGAMEVYNRAEYLPERRAAWRLWGATLAAIRRATREKTSSTSSPHRLRSDRARAVSRTKWQ